MNYPFKTKSAVSADFLEVRIEGERILLSPVSEEHAQDIFHEFTEDITRYMMPKPLTDMAHAYEFVNTCRKNMKAGLELILAITKATSGEFLGICAIHGTDAPQVAELGVWIKKSAHGKKLGREAIRCLAEWGRKNLLLSYLIYPVARDNIPSRKIAESLGGVVLEERVRKSMSGATLNEIVYKIEAQ